MDKLLNMDSAVRGIYAIVYESKISFGFERSGGSVWVAL
jgi:hypothetical protein